MVMVQLLGPRVPAVAIGKARRHLGKKDAEHGVIARRPQVSFVASVHLVDDALPPGSIVLGLLWSEPGLQFIGLDGHGVQRVPLLVTGSALRDGVEHLVPRIECIADAPVVLDRQQP